MDPWQSLLVGLATGVAGVLVGTYISSRQQRAEQRRLDESAARVTFFEVAENMNYFETAIAKAVTTPVNTTTWSETRTRLASMLTPDEIVTVANAYLMLLDIEKDWARFPLATPIGPDHIEAAQKALDQLGLAIDILQSRGWPKPEDRVALRARIDEQRQ